MVPYVDCVLRECLERFKQDLRKHSRPPFLLLVDFTARLRDEVDVADERLLRDSDPGHLDRMVDDLEVRAHTSTRFTSA